MAMTIKKMKTAEEWLDMYWHDSEIGATVIEQIQQDAYRAGEQAGMTEAAEMGHSCWNPMIKKL